MLRPSLRRPAVLGILCSLVLGMAGAPAPEWKRVVYEQDFSRPESLKELRVTDPRAWRWSETGGGALELFQQSKYQAPVRSPFNLALLSKHRFRDFVLELECQQTSQEYGHRDLCFFFGLQSPTRFYYAHLATSADNHAHNIFRVNETPRVKVGTETTRGVAWGATNQWHKIRIERNADDGTIRVFFNDMTRPVMAAQDKTFLEGYVGLGSFDDVGRFRRLRLEGTAVDGAGGAFYTAF
ncbi:MAG: hypothetical protein FJ404_00885 [Verrucomicrobia bacterium]|nr:hypothetical protein [Verrucomicrobiota bacterium]